MALKFWLGGAADDKSRRMIQYILDEAGKNPGRQYLVVAPEQFGLATQKELVFNSPNKGILNIDVLSFSRLAHRISDEVGSYRPDITTLDDMGKSLLIGMLAAKHRQELKAFGNDLDKLGIMDKIKSVISEFMQYGISPDKAFELAGAAEKAGRGILAAKLGDIALLYKEFKDHIKDRYTTVEETLDTVSSLVPHSETIRNSVIVFDGFTGFTPVQNKLIGVLMEYALDLHVALLLEDCIQENGAEDEIKEHELFYLSKKTIRQLERMADERRVIIADPYRSGKYAINNIRNQNTDIVYNNTEPTFGLNNATVHIFAGKDPEEEIHMVFTRIADLIREEGYRYRDIAILAGDIESYRHLIAGEFDKHGIPFFIDRTEPVLLNPFIEYIRSFIDIISDNYSQSAVFRFLKSGLADISDDDINTLENYCIAAGVKGYGRWHKDFAMTTKTFRADVLPAVNEIRARFVKKCDLFTETLKLTRYDAAETGDHTVNAGSVYTIRQFSTALYRLIESEGIEDKLRTVSGELAAEGKADLSGQYGNIYVRIMDILDELCELIPDEKTDIRGFKNLLDTGLDNIRIGIIPPGLDHVQVGDLRRSRFDDIRALFIVGANDGIIPAVSSGGGLLNEDEREFLTGCDEKLILAPSAREDIYTQQLYIYMALNKPEDHLFVSYAGVSLSGGSLLPSYIVKKLMNEHPGTIVERVPELVQYYSDEAEAFDELAGFIYPAVSGTLPPEKRERTRELMRYFLDRSGYRERLMKMLEYGILHAGADAKDSIGAALAKAIYGKRISTSITRLEYYANCAYQHFLKFGLSLREREVFALDTRDTGNMFHDSMQEYSQLMTEGGHNWATITDSERDKLMDMAVDRVMERYRPNKLSSSARNAYVEQRVRRIMRRSADIVCSQIKKGRFVPRYFEIAFERMEEGGTIPARLSEDEMIRLRGRIDRIDTCETDDGIYIRVIDYKSSAKQVDLAAVYEGRQLQLLVYMNAAMEMERDRLKKDGKETKVIPAGVLYYAISDPILKADAEADDGEIHRMIMKNHRMKGLVNIDTDVLRLMDENIAADPTVIPVSFKEGMAKKSDQVVSEDDLAVLSEYVTDCICRMGSEILSGNIAVPAVDGKTRFSGPKCKYCSYVSICRNGNSDISDEEGETEDGDTGTADDTVGTEAPKGADAWIGLMKKRMVSENKRSGT